MTLSSTLRCAAGFLLAAIFLLPAVATAGESPRGRIGAAPAEPASFLAGLWSSLGQLLPGEWRPVSVNAQGDNGWQLDPNGINAQPDPGADNGWQLDPNG